MNISQQVASNLCSCMLKMFVNTKKIIRLSTLWLYRIHARKLQTTIFICWLTNSSGDKLHGSFSSAYIFWLDRSRASQCYVAFVRGVWPIFRCNICDRCRWTPTAFPMLCRPKIATQSNEQSNILECNFVAKKFNVVTFTRRRRFRLLLSDLY